MSSQFQMRSHFEVKSQRCFSVASSTEVLQRRDIGSLIRTDCAEEGTARDDEELLTFISKVTGVHGALLASGSVAN